ncbi:MAG: ACT domain-containing protein [Peptostreptococcaceae bacterium]|nr:ACT domain-containing protein [Peptostreptococcaceae bacterium]
MSKKKFLVINEEILPDIFGKVIEAKELLRRGRVEGVTQAVKEVGISRSTFYKYKDYVFRLSEESLGRKVTISMLLSHNPGILSKILDTIAKNKGNILTISQDIPINAIANVSITFDISDVEGNVNDIVDTISLMDGVEKIDLIAME